LDENQGKTRQFATFYVGELFFGIEAVRVQEIIRNQDMTPIPLAPRAIKGLINLRGQIVTAVDARSMLALPPAEKGTEPMNIVIQAEDGAVSLLVDEIGDVLDIPLNSYAPVPDNLPEQQRALISAVYQLNGSLLLALNTERLLGSACN
jgi:purine-binding chemotaxis protein CheW